MAICLVLSTQSDQQNNSKFTKTSQTTKPIIKYIAVDKHNMYPIKNNKKTPKGINFQSIKSKKKKKTKTLWKNKGFT